MPLPPSIHAQREAAFAAFANQSQAGANGAPMDWIGLGLVLALVGCFLMANGVLWRDPRKLIEQHFGGRPRPLRSLREALFNRVQIVLGFLFLIAGFGAQLWGRAHPGADGELSGSTALWVGGIVVLAIVLEAGAWWWSLRTFRRRVRRHLRANPPDLESDMAMARELGELFGVRSHGDDTVESFLVRLRATAGLERPLRASRPVAGEPPAESELDELHGAPPPRARPGDLPGRA